MKKKELPQSINFLTQKLTRFKGLGEISPNEFGNFIGENIRLEPIILNEETSIPKLLEYFMGKNTPERQEFIIENLKVELEALEDEMQAA